MPLSRAPRAPDLERVVQVLGGQGAGLRADEPSPGGWVPSRPGGAAPRLKRPVVPGPEGEPGGDLERELRRARRPGLMTLPEPLRHGRVAVSSTAVVSVLALVVALGCAFVVRILWAERAVDGGDRAGAVRTAVADGAGRAGGAMPEVVSRSAESSASAVGDPGGGSGSRSEVVVHVVGHVRKPGLVRLPAGARVADALKAAGGAKPGAALASLNLARVVADGEQIVVAKPGEAGTVAAGPEVGGGPVGGQSGAGSTPVNLNTADLTSLDTLPGVGPVLAQRILDWRTEHGRFTSVDELGEVSGIGDKLMAQLRPKVTV